MDKRRRSQRRRRFTPEEIERTLAAYRRSNVTQRAFAEARGLAYSTLTQWLSKERQGRLRREEERKRPTGSRLIEIDGPLSSGGPEGYAIQTPEGWRLEVPCGFDPEELGKFVETVRRACLS